MKTTLAQDLENSIKYNYRRYRYFQNYRLMCENYCRSVVSYFVGDAETSKKVKFALANDLIKKSREGCRDVPSYICNLVNTLLAGTDITEGEEKEAAKYLDLYGHNIPFCDEVSKIRGFTAFSYAHIIAESGCPSKYSNPAKLWTRFGLGLVGDERQRKYRDAAKAAEHQYNPHRRAILFVISENLLRARDPYYRKEYDRQKDKFLARGKSKRHAHMHGMRCMAKLLLKNIWKLWHNQEIESSGHDDRPSLKPKKKRVRALKS